MKFQLSISLLIAAASSVAAGPFTIRWFSERGCGGRSLGCNGYESFECCAQPPSPSSFPTMRATTSGPVGILVFTEVTNTGGCGLCTSTGSLNTCYLNAPFETAYVAGLSQCQPNKRSADQHLTARLAAFEQHVECNSSVPIDTATINGHDYAVSGPETERLQIMADVVDLSGEEFAVKWASKYRGPATLGTPTSLATASTGVSDNTA
ncbi:hypothetical protein NKR19_g7980 [Coniochaeta hoffmannii]|uniref:Uncharacterized protein n=1 Tax=Coniochaeta hoffmannii TaxID=91930 RepID=A0AA38RPU9_9PEZI|nr:hypothetical protein NKR19_g7980 [Coniochaeta hoffmannii]